MPPRELRRIVPLEAACVVAIAVVPLPHGLSVAVPLLAVASLSRWLRGRSWRELVERRRDGLVVTRRRDAIVVAIFAGALAVAVAGPLYRAFGVSPLEWWQRPATADARLAILIALVVVEAIALELALRGWIVERMLELSPGSGGLPILVAALAEALVVGGAIGARIGIVCFGAGTGLLYLATGRNVLVPIVARAVFAAGSVAWAALLA